MCLFSSVLYSKYFDFIFFGFKVHDPHVGYLTTPDIEKIFMSVQTQVLEIFCRVLTL